MKPLKVRFLFALLPFYFLLFTFFAALTEIV
jgi:hypothetical protein